jgi:Bacterial membrane protein YfhO
LESRRIAQGLLVASLACQIFWVGREAWDPPPDFNDDVSHAALARACARAWTSGADPTDPWLVPTAFGFPLAHHYQHLLHVVVGGLSALTGFGVEGILRWTVALALMLLPISFAWSLRRVGASMTVACSAGALAPLVATPSLYGIDLSSYLWGGHGLSTQAVGVTLLPVVVAATVRALRGESHPVTAGALIAVLILTHTVFGWLAALSAVALAVGLRAPPRRLFWLGTFAACGTAYFVIPFWQDSLAMSRSVWEAPEKYDSYGLLERGNGRWQGVLAKLAAGELLDDRSFSDPDPEKEGPGVLRRAFVHTPSLTLLAAAGALIALRRGRRDPVARGLLIGFALSLLLYAGPRFWGDAVRLLPMAGGLHFHRLIVPVQLTALGLAGVALAAALERAARLRAWGAVAVALGAALLLAPPLGERFAMSQLRRSWQAETQQAAKLDAGRLERVLAQLAREAPARSYAGRAKNWGKRHATGYVPVYSRLMSSDLDQISYAYHNFSYTAEVQNYFDERRPSHFDLFNVRWVVAPSERALPPFLTVRSHDGRYQVAESAASGYFGLADAFGRFGGDRRSHFEATRDWLAGPGPDRGWHPVFEPPGGANGLPSYRDASLPLTDPPPRGRILSQRVEPGLGIAELDAARATHLLFKVTHHPRWHAYLDERRVDVLRVAPGFMAVAVTPGRHTVRFAYQPPAWRMPVLIAGWSILLGIPLYHRAIRRPRDS